MWHFWLHSNICVCLSFIHSFIIYLFNSVWVSISLTVFLSVSPFLYICLCDCQPVSLYASVQQHLCQKSNSDESSLLVTLGPHMTTPMNFRRTGVVWLTCKRPFHTL